MSDFCSTSGTNVIFKCRACDIEVPERNNHEDHQEAVEIFFHMISVLQERVKRKKMPKQESVASTILLKNDTLASLTMNKEILEDLLAKAVHAPSGENTQPWRFEVTQDFHIFLCNIQSRDTSTYNLDNRSAFVGFGALIENITILSSSYGFTAETSLFPKSDEATCIAEIVFKDSPPTPHPLEKYILERHSNREEYLPATFSQDFIASIKQLTEDDPSLKIHITTSVSEIRTLSKALSVNDFLILHNNVLGKFFFSHIIWTKAELIRHKIGFYLPTFGLSFFDRIGIRFLRMTLLRKLSRLFSLPYYTAYKSAKKIATASLIGCITISLDTPEAFISVGRMLQRAWLTSSQRRYSFQAFGITLLYQALSPLHHVRIFDALEKEKINQMYTTVQGVYQLDKEIPCMMFRIGKAKNPVMKSEKMNPKITYI